MKWSQIGTFCIHTKKIKKYWCGNPGLICFSCINFQKTKEKKILVTMQIVLKRFLQIVLCKIMNYASYCVKFCDSAMEIDGYVKKS